MDKQNVVHPHDGIFFSHKKEGSSVHVTIRTLKMCSVKQARHKRTSISQVQSHGPPRIVTFVKTERKIVVTRDGGRTKLRVIAKSVLGFSLG